MQVNFIILCLEMALPEIRRELRTTLRKTTSQTKGRTFIQQEADERRDHIKHHQTHSHQKHGHEEENQARQAAPTGQSELSRKFQEGISESAIKGD